MASFSVTRNAIVFNLSRPTASAPVVFSSTPVLRPHHKLGRLTFVSSTKYNQGGLNYAGDEDNSGERSREYAKEGIDRAAERAEHAKKRSGEMKEKVKESAEDTKEKAKEYAHETKEATKGAAQSAAEKAKQGTHKAAETAERGKEEAKDTANKAESMVESLGEKAKQTVKGAWDAAMETTHKIKETVVGKDDDHDLREKRMDEDVADSRRQGGTNKDEH